jgi:hypothetical protein
MEILSQKTKQNKTKRYKLKVGYKSTKENVDSFSAAFLLLCFVLFLPQGTCPTTYFHWEFFSSPVKNEFCCPLAQRLFCTLSSLGSAPALSLHKVTLPVI